MSLENRHQSQKSSSSENTTSKASRNANKNYKEYLINIHLYNSKVQGHICQFFLKKKFHRTGLKIIPRQIFLANLPGKFFSPSILAKHDINEHDFLYSQGRQKE